MKKIMTTMLGLTLALGSATLFAQEGKTGDTKTAEKTTKTTKTKSHKAHKSSKAKTGTETAPAADATKK